MEQLRKITHDAYYAVYKAYAITDFQQLTLLARGCRACLALISAHAWR